MFYIFAYYILRGERCIAQMFQKIFPNKDKTPTIGPAVAKLVNDLSNVASNHVSNNKSSAGERDDMHIQIECKKDKEVLDIGIHKEDTKNDVDIVISYMKNNKSVGEIRTKVRDITSEMKRWNVAAGNWNIKVKQISAQATFRNKIENSIKLFNTTIGASEEPQYPPKMITPRTIKVKAKPIMKKPVLEPFMTLFNTLILMAFNSDDMKAKDDDGVLNISIKLEKDSETILVNVGKYYSFDEAPTVNAFITYYVGNDVHGEINIDDVEVSQKSEYITYMKNLKESKDEKVQNTLTAMKRLTVEDWSLKQIYVYAHHSFAGEISHAFRVFSYKMGVFENNAKGRHDTYVRFFNSDGEQATFKTLIAINNDVQSALRVS